MKLFIGAIVLSIYPANSSGSPIAKIGHKYFHDHVGQDPSRRKLLTPTDPETISEKCYQRTIANMQDNTRMFDSCDGEDCLLQRLVDGASTNPMGHVSFFNSSEAVMKFMDRCENHGFNGKVVFVDVEFPGELCQGLNPQKFIGYPSCVSALCDPSEYGDLLQSIVTVGVEGGDPGCIPGHLDTYRIDASKVEQNCAVDMNFLITNELIYRTAIGTIIQIKEENPGIIEFNGNVKGLQRFSSLCESNRGHVVLSDLNTTCTDTPNATNVPLCIADTCSNTEAEDVTNYWFSEHNDCTMDVSIIEHGRYWDCEKDDNNGKSPQKTKSPAKLKRSNAGPKQAKDTKSPKASKAKSEDVKSSKAKSAKDMKSSKAKSAKDEDVKSIKTSKSKDAKSPKTPKDTEITVKGTKSHKDIKSSKTKNVKDTKALNSKVAEASKAKSVKDAKSPNAQKDTAKSNKSLKAKEAKESHPKSKASTKADMKAKVKSAADTKGAKKRNSGKSSKKSKGERSFKKGKDGKSSKKGKTAKL